MKLGLVHIILIMGMGALMLGTAGGMLTAYQSLMPPSTEVGQTATLMVSLTNNGPDSILAKVRPSPPGVFANGGGEQSLELYPGMTQQFSYTLNPQQSGSYLIESFISYAEGGASWRSLRLQDPFTVSELQPDQTGPGGDAFPGPGDNSNPTDNPYDQPPGEEMPEEEYPPVGEYPVGPADQNPPGVPPAGPKGSGEQPDTTGQ